MNAREMIVAGLPLKRHGTGEEIASLMLVPPPDASSICTGGVYSADGGLLGDPGARPTGRWRR